MHIYTGNMEDAEDRRSKHTNRLMSTFVDAHTSFYAIKTGMSPFRRFLLVWVLRALIGTALIESSSSSASRSIRTSRSDDEKRAGITTYPGAWSLPRLRAVRGGGGAESVSLNNKTDHTTIHSVMAIFHLGGAGAGDDSHHGSVESSPVSWLVGEDATPFSAVLLGEQKAEAADSDEKYHAIVRIPRLPSDTNMMASLGILSDVIVVVLPSSSDDADQSSKLLNEASERLMQIASAEEAQQFPRKKQLVVISESAEDSGWVDDVVQNRLRSVTPSLWETFDVLTPQQWKTQWEEEAQTDSLVVPFLEGNDGTSTSVIQYLTAYEDNAPVFAKLVQQVYQYRCKNDGGASSLREMDHDDARLFALENMPPAVRVVPTGASNEDGPSQQTLKTPTKRTRTRTRGRPASSSSSSLEEDPQDRIQRILQEAQGELADLESKMQEIQLQSQSKNQMMLPLLDFGGAANAILEGAYQQLEISFPPSVRTGFMNRLVVEVHQLYTDQLESLRDYYGRRYEQSLDQEEDEAVWAREAEHMTQGFQTAAQYGVPSLCQGDAPLAKIVSFESVHALQGLIHDMLEATQLRKDEQSLAFDEDYHDDDLEDLAPKRRYPPWVKKIVSRAVALGINYLQGWLAWQGVKRAALERDREMPKFPLF